MEPNFLCKRCRTRRFKARLGASKLAWQIEQIEQIERSANVDALRGDAWDRSQNGRLWFENMSKLSIKVGLSVFEWCLLYCKFLCMTGLNWAFIPVVSRPLGVQSFQVWGCLGVCGGVPLDRRPETNFSNLLSGNNMANSLLLTTQSSVNCLLEPKFSNKLYLVTGVGHLVIKKKRWKTRYSKSPTFALMRLLPAAFLSSRCDKTPAFSVPRRTKTRENTIQMEPLVPKSQERISEKKETHWWLSLPPWKILN